MNIDHLKLLILIYQLLILPLERANLCLQLGNGIFALLQALLEYLVLIELYLVICLQVQVLLDFFVKLLYFRFLSGQLLYHVGVVVLLLLGVVGQHEVVAWGQLSGLLLGEQLVELLLPHCELLLLLIKLFLEVLFIHS